MLSSIAGKDVPTGNVVGESTARGKFVPPEGVGHGATLMLHQDDQTQHDLHLLGLATTSRNTSTQHPAMPAGSWLTRTAL